jgi:hypothetical protein
MMAMRWLAFTLLAGTVFSGIARAATYTAGSCNTSDVQTAINSASAGDTVIIPGGTCTWTSGVAISGKGIYVQGQGGGRIVAYSSSNIAIGTGSKTLSVASTLVASPPSFNPGDTLTVSETGNRQNYMIGTVASYSAGTLVMNITSSGGACGNSSSPQSPSNCARWLISTQPTTVFVNNASTTMFNVTEDSTIHTTLSGFKIAHTTNNSGTGAGITFNPGGGQAILVHDVWIEQNSGDSIWTGVNRGVVWNASFDSTPYSMAPLAVHLQPYDQTAWTSAGYWGALDTDGEHNFYVESSDFHAYLNAADNDEAARSVFRYNTFNNAGFGTHGVDTGLFGQRYFEYYNNVGNFNGYSNGNTFNMNWWMFLRGGSFVVFNNTLPPLQSQDYGTKQDINMTEMSLQRNAGPIPCWGAGTSGGKDYYAPRQVGLGYVTGAGVDGIGQTTYSLAAWGWPNQYVGDPEPAYIWGNSRQPLTNVGTSDYGSGQADSCKGSVYDTSANYIVSGRDYFNGNTAKPGYTPYTYPHPLTQGNTQGPQAPTGLAATVN